MQAAVGCAQIEKFPSFVQHRRQNFKKLYDGLKDIKELILVKTQPHSEPSWFGFMMTVADGAKFSRNELSEHLEKAGVQTRNLFAGNMIKHPLFVDLKLGVDYKISGELKNTDKIMKDSFWVGVYPGMSDEKIGYIIKVIKEFISTKN